MGYLFLPSFCCADIVLEEDFSVDFWTEWDSKISVALVCCIYSNARQNTFTMKTNTMFLSLVRDHIVCNIGYVEDKKMKNQTTFAGNSLKVS